MCLNLIWILKFSIATNFHLFICVNHICSATWYWPYFVLRKCISRRRSLDPISRMYPVYRCYSDCWSNQIQSPLQKNRSAKWLESALRSLFLAARPSGSIHKYETESWCAIERNVVCITDEIFGRIKLFCFYFTVKNMFNEQRVGPWTQNSPILK